MANPEHVEKLVTSTADDWDEWRKARDYEPLEIANYDLGAMRREAVEPIDGQWADFRCFNLLFVNLTSCSMFMCDLSGAKLDHFEWRDVELTFSKLNRIKSRKSDFIDCDMNKVEMQDAELYGTIFLESTLHDAKLNGSTLAYTDFSQSDLTGAVFVGANLESASLTRASLACTNLDDARYIYAPPFGYVFTHIYGNSTMKYRSEVRAIKNDIQTELTPSQWIWDNRMGGHLLKTLSSRATEELHEVQDLIDKLGNVERAVRDGGMSHRFRFYFRGQACRAWRLNSSLNRSAVGSRESQLIDEMMLSRPEEFANCESLMDCLVLARHFGLPTRLIDVTRNPLVALYFACAEMDPCDQGKCDRVARLNCFVTPPEMVKSQDSDTVSVLAAFPRLDVVQQSVLLTRGPEGGCERSTVSPRHDSHHRPSYSDAMHRLVHFIAREKPYFEERVDPKDFFRVLVVEPKQMFPRMRAQASAFLLSAFHQRFEAERISKIDPGMPVYGHIRFDIPFDAKNRILRQLDALNINEETIFPGLEATARTVTARHAKSVANDWVRNANRGQGPVRSESGNVDDPNLTK